jgi:hypothetical protein
MNTRLPSEIDFWASSEDCWPVVGFGVEVKPSTIFGAGLGAFATKSYKSGDTYDGILRDKTQVINARSVKRSGATDRNTSSHILKLPRSSACVFGLTVPSWGRGAGSFCNHSSSNQNAKIQCVIPKSSRQLQLSYFGAAAFDAEFKQYPIALIQATKDIAEGEEIFVKYGRSTCDRLGISGDDLSSEVGLVFGIERSP